MTQRTIRVDLVYPSIGFRHFDYCAYYDGQEESQRYGYGETEQEAIDDLLARDDEDDQ